MKYDDAKYHYQGNYPPGLAKENAAIHMGMLMAWAIKRDLVSDFHKNEHPRQLEQVKDNPESGRDFVMNVCDGRITDEDFNEVGNTFLKGYYDQSYLKDYFSVVDPEDTAETAYSIENSNSNYIEIGKLLDKKFDAWNGKKPSFFHRILAQ